MPEYDWIDEDLFIVRNFFTPEECTEHIEWSERSGFQGATILTAQGHVIASDVRNNARVIRDDEQLSELLWNRSQGYIPSRLEDWQAVGLNERFRYYRYDVGQQFDWHSDGCFERSSGERSHLTFLIYLNQDFSGGATTIENRNFEPEAGMVLGFRHYLIHKGQPVTQGRKYVLRTDVMYRLER